MNNIKIKVKFYIKQLKENQKIAVKYIYILSCKRLAIIRII